MPEHPVQEEQLQSVMVSYDVGEKSRLLAGMTALAGLRDMCFETVPYGCDEDEKKTTKVKRGNVPFL